MFVKELVGALASPLTIALLIGGWAAFCWMRGWKQIAVCSLWLTAAVAYFGAIGPVGDALLGPLERQYPPLRLDQSLPKVGYVVVLGSGYTPRNGIAVTAALDEEGLVRIVEGIRLARKIGGVRLVVSGGSRRGGAPPALGYAELARDLGVDNASLLVLDRPLDTSSEARAVSALLGQAPFVLVTSASHMPRAVRLMEHAGAHPIPAPTGQDADEPSGGSWRRWLPNSGGLRKTERALHEYLGLAAIAEGD
jgi:uncharacterized SAM-binding protein YcdF (DUF218 family)